MNLPGHAGEHAWGSAALALAFATLVPCASAWSQPCPTKLIRLIAPFAAGAGTDTPWRIVSKRLADALGTSIQIENRPGAGSSLGAAVVAAAVADGYTMLGTSGSHAVSGATYRKLPYDTFSDFTWVGQI